MIWRKKDTDTSTPDLPSLSRKEALIMELLVSGGREFYGLEMVDASNGELKRGTIYVTLQRLQEKGLIDSRQEARTAPEIGIPRRLYSITGYGQRVFSAYQKIHSILGAEFAYE
jgi:PadR family transcriptional regulator, regulatory protein PadR